MKLYTSVSSSKLSITETTKSRVVLNMCEYVFSVSSIIDNKNNKHNLEIITNKKEIEINKKEYQDIINYLNNKTHSNFILIDEYKKLIANILKKYTINDIKTVIDKKTSEWINNPKMKPYLTPETLFGPKFEGYLHQQAKAKTIQDISLEDIRRAKKMRDKQNG